MILQWVVIFLVIAVIAGIFGFGGIAAESAWIAKLLFVIFLALFIAAFFFNGPVR
jgi:uncharacterized membrane protein YtjA (UPF0391 family)